VDTPSVNTNGGKIEASVPFTARGPSVAVGVLFSSTIFLGAFLLFLIEPLFAKLILPWFGGTAAVWATCLVFFQSALLLGYWYADFAARRLAPKRFSLLHLALLLVSLFLLPIAPQAFWRGHATIDPAWRILGLLTFSIGLPFFLLSATSPLVQAWYARGGSGKSPYHLYALSNAASLLALLSFPFLIEPRLSSHRQRVLWSVFYALFVVLCGAAAWVSRGSEEMSVPSPNQGRAEARPYAESAEEEPSGRTKLLWFGLAACGSMMLLSVTNHLAENVAPVPLLWVIPLALYLLSFAIVFAKRRLYSRWLVVGLLAVAIGGTGYAVYDGSLTNAVQVSVPVFCSALFIVCLYCHGELAERRPAARYLTEFYLIIALGGAVGSVCVGLLAPRVLSGVYELPLVLLLAATLAAILHWRANWGARLFWCYMAGAMIAVLVFYVRSERQATVARTRDFYGALRVQEFSANIKIPYRMLLHGTIEHGAQFLSWPENRNPTSYYGRRSGVGLALRFCCDGPKRVGVIGLGTGTTAAYGKARDTFRFYEIDPQVVRIANGWFSYLKQTPATTEIVLGDARLSLESEPPQEFDVLVVDAFSGDAIPVHLLTREAFALYSRHLKPNGVLAVHISNTYVDLAPVVKLLAEDANYAYREITSGDDDPGLISAADWVLVTRNQEFLNIPETFAGSQNIEVPEKLRVWTDDDNNLFQVLKGFSFVARAAGGS
jgi:hypothetical protein